MESSKACIPLDDTQLGRWTEQANALLVAVKWAPRPLRPPTRKGAPSTAEYRESTATGPAVEDKLSLVGIARRVSGDPVLLSEDTNHVLTEVRNGLRIGMQLSHVYTKSAGLETLIEMNGRGALSDAQKTEFRAKYETASAVTVFAAAYYVTGALGDYKAEEVGAAGSGADGVPEVSLLNPVRALDCMLYYYAASLEKSGEVRTGAEFVKTTLLYFQAVIQEIRRRV